MTVPFANLIEPQASASAWGSPISNGEVSVGLSPLSPYHVAMRWQD
jgi:hypothetical protein